MKRISLEQATLDGCISEAQQEQLIITRKGKPVALMVGVTGMDEDQLALGSSQKFWTLIETRRKQKTLSRAELEEKISKRKA